MAETGDTDGVETIEHDSSSSSKLSNADQSEPMDTQENFSTVVSSSSRHFDMDNDDDGAPTTETSPKHHRAQYNAEGDDIRERIVSFDSSAESTPRKSLTKSKNSASNPQISSKPHDLSMLDMKTSWDGTVPSSTTSKGETAGCKTGYEIAFKRTAGVLADPIKIAKEREKEERVRQARERLLEERKKKLDELREQQKMAQENREKQLEMRRKKIDDLRKRDIERRSAVEERRKIKEEVEKARRESILQKAEERVARYEAWKAGGRKGGRGHVLGFGSATPRDICQPIERPRRSSSHSALQRRSPNGSDVDSVRPQRRAISACSAVRRHIDNNRIGVFGGGDSPTKQLSLSTSVLYSKRSQEYLSMSTLHPTSRPSTSVGTTTTTPPATATTHYYPRPIIAAVAGGSPLSRACMTASLPSPVRIRDSKPPRKPRPASVASSMPSFLGGEPAKSQRSKSTDRTGRDRSRTRTPRKDDKADKKKEEEKAQKQDQSEEKTQEDVKEHAEKKERKEKVSLSFLNRLSVSKYSRKDLEPTSKETAPKKESPIIRTELVDERDLDGVVEAESPQQHSPRKAYSTSNLATMKKRSSLKEKQSPTATKESGPKIVPPRDTHHGTTPTSGGPAPSVPLPAAAVRSVSPVRKIEKSSVKMVSPSHKVADKSGSTTPVISHAPAVSSAPIQAPVSTPTHGPAVLTPTPGVSSSDVSSAVSTSPQPPAAATADDGTTALRTSMGPTQDISAEEYKARLAEKRRQAREKAEKEAEEERRRQEEARLAEEESQRKEEEEDRRLEEEAEVARKAEEERLQKAIEAEEKRRKEEAEKLEQEKKLKEEADRKAKAEMERLDKEKQEKARREEEERLERKKKLEMIMKRVKVDTEGPPKIESPTKPVNTFPSTGQASSSQNSPEEEQERHVSSSEASDEEGSNGLPVAEGSAVEVYSADMTMSFMQGFEEMDMPVSTISAASALSSSLLSRNIPDRPPSQAYPPDERLSRSAGTTPLKLEEITLTESAFQGKAISLATSIEPEKPSQEEKRRRSDITDRQTKAETQTVDVQKQEKTRKEDEERLERKKRLEMIMKRVKADTETQPKTDGPTKSVSMYSSVTHLSSSQSSPEEEQEKSVVSSEVSDEEGNGLPVAEGSAVEVYSAAMTTSFMQDFEDADMTASTSSSTSTVTRSVSSGNILDSQSSRPEAHDQSIDDRLSQSADTTPLKPEVKTTSSAPSSETKPTFKSPLLQQLVGNNGADSDGPRFKSPLLQNLLGKTRVGARMGLSASMGDLSRNREPSSQSQAEMFNSQSSLSVVPKDSSSSSGEVSTQEHSREPKAADRYTHMFNGVGRDSGDAHFPTSTSKSSFDSSPHDTSRLYTPVMSDSALGSSIELHGDGMMSQSVLVNGHGNHKTHGMEDSSISLFSVEEGVSKTSATTFETLLESDKPAAALPTQDDEEQFDDLINFGEAPVRVFEESSRRSEFATDYLS